MVIPNALIGFDDINIDDLNKSNLNGYNNV